MYKLPCENVWEKVRLLKTSIILISFPASQDLCFLLSCLLMYLGSLYCKHFGLRSDHFLALINDQFLSGQDHYTMV